MAENVAELLIPANNLDSPLKEIEMSNAEKEIRGVWEAMQYVDRIARNYKKPMDEDFIREVHRRVMKYFHPEVAGRYRGHDVAVSKAIFLPPHWSEVKQLMWQLGKELEERAANLDISLSGTKRAVTTASLAHYKLVRIHPFSDGNGRTARLLADAVCKRAELYYPTEWGSDRDDYINVLKTVDQAGDLNHLERFLARRLASRHDEVIDHLTKGPLGKNVEKSTLFAQIRERRSELMRIAATPVPNIFASH